MSDFTISLKGSNQTTVFKMNLSKANSNMFSFWGTNLQGSSKTANSITVKTKEDYDFVTKAFTALAKSDGNAKDITDKDFAGMNKTDMNCGNPNIKKNVWHSHSKGEYNYHQGGADSANPGKTIWLSDHDDEGV